MLSSSSISFSPVMLVNELWTESLALAREDSLLSSFKRFPSMLIGTAPRDSTGWTRVDGELDEATGKMACASGMPMNSKCQSL